MKLNKAKIGDEIHVVKGKEGSCYQDGDIFVIVFISRKKRKSFFDIGPFSGITMQRRNSDKENYTIGFNNGNGTFKLVAL